MELVVFIGLQGSGKSTFHAQRFADTHIRLNLDMLKTRHREALLFEACLVAKQPVVIDNTNPTIAERARYIIPAREQGFSVVGYYFQSRVEDCKERNLRREPDRSVPVAGLLGTYKRMVLPTLSEGFDKLFYVSIDESGAFVVQEWSDEV
jgi:predicted kinase